MIKHLLMTASIFLLLSVCVHADAIPDDLDTDLDTVAVASSSTGDKGPSPMASTNLLSKMTDQKKTAGLQQPVATPQAPKKTVPAASVNASETEPIVDSKESYTIDKDSLNAFVNIQPESVTPVPLSSSDVNRIHCESIIKDVIYSKEKNIKVDYTEKDAFIKFLILRKDGKLIYASTPSEIYVVCGNSVYTMLALPSRIPAQTVRLVAPADKLKKNMSLFDGLPLEKKVMNIIGYAYRDEIPDSFTVVSRESKVYDNFADLSIKAQAEYRIDGESLSLKIFRISLKSDKNSLELAEKDFLRADMTKKPVAIALDKHRLQPGANSRLFIVEHAEEMQ